MVNKNINGKECIEHSVEISPYIHATIYIPESMTSTEFKGIMLMSNQLIKISASREEEERTITKSIIEWDNEKIERLKVLALTKTAAELAKIFGTTYSNIKNRCRQLRVNPKKSYRTKLMKQADNQVYSGLSKINKSMSNKQRQKIYDVFHKANDNEKDRIAKLIGCKNVSHVYKLIWQWKHKEMVKYNT